MTQLRVLLALFAFQGVAANAVETTITILGVRFSGANSTQAGNLLTQVAQYWPTATGTTITLANGGIPLSIGTALSGTDEQQMNQAKLIAYGMNLRNVHGADVIFFFTTRWLIRTTKEFVGGRRSGIGPTAAGRPPCSMIPTVMVST
jgi:hypothetical protein